MTLHVYQSAFFQPIPPPILPPVVLIAAPGAQVGYASGSPSTSDTTSTTAPAGSAVFVFASPLPVNSTITAITDSSGNNYTIFGISSNVNTPGITIGCTILTSSLPAGSTFTVTTAASANYGIRASWWVNGVTNPVPDVKMIDSGSGTTSTLTTGTLVSQNEILFNLIYVPSGTTSYTRSPAFSDLTQSLAGGIHVGYLVDNTTSPVTAAVSWTPTSLFGRLLVSYTNGIPAALIWDEMPRSSEQIQVPRTLKRATIFKGDEGIALPLIPTFPPLGTSWAESEF